MKRTILVLLALAVLLGAAAISVACLDPTRAAAEPVPPPEKLVGPCAFSDETGRMTLQFPGGKARTPGARTVSAVTGELKIRVGPDEFATIPIEGTYDDSDGHVVAWGQGSVDGVLTSYAVDGYYVSGSGFTGTIERIRDGEVASGEVAAIGEESEGTLEIRVFTGLYGAPETSETWKYIVYPGDPPEGEPYEVETETDYRYDLDDDAGMGTFCFTCSDQLLMGVFHNYPWFDDQEASGVMVGQFTDSPANSHFELEVTGRDDIAIWGQIAGSDASGDWEMQHWLPLYFDEEVNFWCHKRVTQIGTFTGTLVP